MPVSGSPFGTFAPGPYTATYEAPAGQALVPGSGAGARDVGLVEGVRRFERTAEGEEIRADLYAETVIGAVWQGGQAFALMTFKEFNQTIRDILWPFDTAFGGIGEPMGRLMEQLAGELTLTAVPGTPAAANGPGILRFGLAIISPGHNSSIILGSSQRDIPIVFRCFPYFDTVVGKTVWFTET